MYIYHLPFLLIRLSQDGKHGYTDSLLVKHGNSYISSILCSVCVLSIWRYTRFENGGNQIKNTICKKTLKHWKVSWYLSLSKFNEQDLSYKNWKKSWFVFSRLVIKFPLMLSLYNLYTNTLRRYTISGKFKR
jgi:hypothetical protein